MDNLGGPPGRRASVESADLTALPCGPRDPPAIGTGVGGRLWRHATEIARAEGFTSLRIAADPHAQAFYLVMGATRVGKIPSGSVPGRVLPLLSWVAVALPGAHHE